MSSTIKGLDSFLDVLSLIKDPAKFESKVKELQTETKKYQEVVEAVVKLSDVNDYTQSIRQREESSKETLATANEAAKAIIAKAVTDADQAGASAKEAAKKAREAASAVTKREEVVTVAEKELAVRLAMIAKADMDLSQRQADLANQERDLAERKAKLAAAIR